MENTFTVELRFKSQWHAHEVRDFIAEKLFSETSDLESFSIHIGKKVVEWMEQCFALNNSGWVCQLEKGHKGMHKCVNEYSTMEWNYNKVVE